MPDNAFWALACRRLYESTRNQLSDFFWGEEKKRLGRERKGRYIGGRMKIRSLGEPERWHVIWCYEVEGDAGSKL